MQNPMRRLAEWIAASPLDDEDQAEQDVDVDFFTGLFTAGAVILVLIALVGVLGLVL